MRKLLLFVALVFITPVMAFAASIAPSEIVANWTRDASPVSGNSNAWVAVNGDTVLRYTNNTGGTIHTPADIAGDFMLKATFNSLGDDDRIGLVFGWLDASNNYRLSWEGGGQSDNGLRGANLIREQNGTVTNLGTTNTFFSRSSSVMYDLMVSRAGNTIAASIRRVSDGVLLSSLSANDTTFNTGGVGFFTSSNASDFKNIDLKTGTAAIPLPAGLPLLAGGLGAMMLVRRFRKKHA